MELDVDVLRSALLPPEGPFTAVDVVVSTGSTNADLVAAAREGAADRTVLIAGEQTAGRGRRARGWSSPPGSGLYASVLLRPSGVPPHRLGWIPLLGGIATAELATGGTGVPSVLKWPNDVLVAEPATGKLAGVLAEVVAGGEAPAVVLGVGLNVRAPADPVPPGVGGLPAACLADLDATVTGLTELAVGLFRGLAACYDTWLSAGADAAACGLLDRYRARCATIGARVRVELPDERLTGTAVDVDSEGRLVLDSSERGRVTVSAGDVVHLRAVA